MRLLTSTLVWLFGFLGLELTALFWKGCPWSTLTETVRAAIAWWHPIATLVTVILIILYGHFERDWRVRYLVATAIVGAISVGVHVYLRGRFS